MATQEARRPSQRGPTWPQEGLKRALGTSDLIRTILLGFSTPRKQFEKKIYFANLRFFFQNRVLQALTHIFSDSGAPTEPWALF